MSEPRVRKGVVIGAVLAAFLTVGAFSTALNIYNTDGWIVITNSSNDTFEMNWNTTRPTTCSYGEASYWNGSDLLCRSVSSSSGNNNTGYSIHGCGGVNCEVGYYSMAS